MQWPTIGTKGTFGLCELDRAAKAHCSLVLVSLVIHTIHAGSAIVRQAIARYRQRQQARDLRVALRQLDDRILRDLGINRSEIRSVVAKLTGQAERTRVCPDSHALLKPRGERATFIKE